MKKKTLPDSDIIDDNDIISDSNIIDTQYQAFQLFYKMFTMYIIYGHI